MLHLQLDKMLTLIKVYNVERALSERTIFNRNVTQLS